MTCACAKIVLPAGRGGGAKSMGISVHGSLVADKGGCGAVGVNVEPNAMSGAIY